MKRLDSNLLCPSCQGPLQPVQLACDHCSIKVEGPFQLNEFATLAPDDLHFLRIFVRSEGRIRDMETALGLSYPTIRTRLTALKNKLQGATEEPNPSDAPRSSGAPAQASAQSSSETRVREILARLEAGELPFEEAMKQIKKIRSA
jgi:hypothetical protein